MGRTLDNMLKRMLPLPIYNIDSKTIIYKELATYGAMLDKIRDSINSLIKSINVYIAEDEGLSLLEELWGVPRTDLTIGQRIEAIEKRFRLKYNICRIKDVIDFFASLGAEAQITEVYGKFRAYVYITNGALFSLSMRKYITAQALEFFPAHLEVFIDYRTGNWDTLDAKGTMFNTYDNFGYTWDRAEHFE
ncbi:MAG: hypothetical protein UH241_08955 [Acutalibacteraceae bacterium]|nr:hypothetical protein [Acutalibacteraceae bacterium]